MTRRLSVCTAIAALLMTAAPAPTTAAQAMTAMAAVPGPSQAPEWWFDNWDLPALWTAGANGRGITVAVLDTGVQADLPELAGRVVAGANFSGDSAPSPGSSAPSTATAAGEVDLDSQPFSHGTAMASLIIARPGVDNIEGAAPAATVLPVVVPLAEETGDASAPADATAQAIRYAADHGAKVISMSFGALRDAATDPDPCPQDVQDAVDYALDKGALLLAAGGNQGATGSPVAEPGVCLGVVSVGSVNSRLQVSSFSSRHPYLTLSAPGEQIATLSKKPGAGFLGFGTSQATALAAAAIALVWSKYPSESNAQILSRVLSTVADLGPPGHDSSYGYGFVEPAAAIASTKPVTSDNPVFAAVRPLLGAAASLPGPVPDAGRSDAPLGASSPELIRTQDGIGFWLLCACAAGLFALAIGLALRDRSARRSHR